MASGQLYHQNTNARPYPDFLGGRELCSAFFARQGRAPPARCIFQWVGVREQSYIAKCHILRNDLKIGPLKIAEFLHAAMNWWENEIILLTLFKIYTLCWPNTPFLGAKSGKNAFFRKKYPITPFFWEFDAVCVEVDEGALLESANGLICLFLWKIKFWDFLIFSWKIFVKFSSSQCSRQNFAIYMKDKNVKHANISRKPLFIGLLYF